ncbi:hypothetical protein [Streptomyces sp. NPDC051572]|uniref:hypothetical protein n=1 Tax=Streptomyces sp. NPDC051572 TaxID=3155802 RepID=UPI00344B0A46
MTETAVPGFARLPHYAYAQAVVLVDGPGGPYEPDEWNVDAAGGGLLFATFYYRRTAPIEIEVHHGTPYTLDPVVNGEAWPHGLALNWDTADGWTYSPLVDEWSTVAGVWYPLPVDLLASPSVLRAALVRLLDGREDDLPSSTPSPMAFRKSDRPTRSPCRFSRSRPRPRPTSMRLRRLAADGRLRGSAVTRRARRSARTGSGTERPSDPPLATSSPP